MANSTFMASPIGPLMLAVGIGIFANGQVYRALADDVLYLEWKATGGGRRVEDGIDTFIFQDGMIRVQTAVYTVS